MGDLDAHQHFWRYSPAQFDWIDPAGPLARDHFPPTLAHAIADCGVTGTIAVQARQTEAETSWLMDLAAKHNWIEGVIGWIDLRKPDVAVRIACHRSPLLVGLRHVIQDEPDDRFMLDRAFVKGVQTTVATGLAYDILVLPQQALHVPSFLDEMEGGRFVLDHGAKPPIAAGGWHPWADAIVEIARRPNVWCKLSGLVTEADHQHWSADDIGRYMDHLLSHFGPERLIFGSDWPVCRLAATYRANYQLYSSYVDRTCPSHRASIFGDNARSAYQLTVRNGLQSPKR